MSTRLKASSFKRSGLLNVTIPYETLDYISEQIFDISGILDRMHIRMIASLLSTISVAIYTVCAVYAAKILIRGGLKGNRRNLLCVTAAMYTATFIYWVTYLVSQFQTLRAITRHLSDEYSLLSDLADRRSLIPPSECFPGSPLGNLSEYCTSVRVPSYSPVADGWAVTQGDCVGTATLTFNVAIGDAIVWWRVWVLWNKNRPVLVFCGLVLLATLACGIADSVFSCTGGPVIWGTLYAAVSSNITEAGAFFGQNNFGFTAVALLLFSNTLATSLVGYKASTELRIEPARAVLTRRFQLCRRHHLRAKRHFQARVSGVTRVQRALMLLVESGTAYSILWALVLLSNLSWIAPGPLSVETQTTGLDAWTLYMLYFTEGCLVAFVGIYPTLIIILVALDKSEIEKQSLAYSIPVARGLQSSPVRVEVTTDVVCAEDVSGGGGSMRPHSVIWIGPSSPLNRSLTKLSNVTSEDDVG